MVLIDEPAPAVLRSPGFASCAAAILGATSLARCDRALLKLRRLTWDHAAAFRIQCGSDAVLSSFCCRPTATPPSSCCPVASPLSYRDAAIVALRRRCPAALPSSRSAAVVLPRRRHRFVAAPMTPTMFLVTAFRQIVRVDNARHPGHYPFNLSITCQNAWFFSSLPECFRLFSSSSHSSLLSVRYLGRTAEKMIRRCSVREEVLKPCNSGQGASWDRLASEGASRLRTAERGRENRRKRVIQSAKPENGKGGEPIIRRTLSECGGCSSGLSYDGKLAQ